MLILRANIKNTNVYSHNYTYNIYIYIYIYIYASQPKKVAAVNFTFYLLTSTASLWLSDLPKHVDVGANK